MKKLICILAILIASIAQATPLWTVTALNASTYTAVTIPADSGCGNVTWYTSDGSQVYIAKDSSGTNVRPSAVDSNGESWSSVCPSYGTKIIFYAKSFSGTPNIIVLYSSK